MILLELHDVTWTYHVLIPYVEQQVSLRRH